MPSPAPDLLDADVSGLLSGQITFSRELGAQILHWLWGTGWTVLLVILLTWLALRMYGALVERIFAVVEKNLAPTAAVRLEQRLKTTEAILRSLGKVVIVFLAITIVLSRMGVNVAPILASAGIVGIAVGFGAQNLVKDVISGFFIIMEDQYGVGDYIEVGANAGLVERMNLRITQIRNSSGSLITMPNGQVQTVINHSKEWARAVLEVGVCYDEDPDRVIGVLRALGDELRAEMPEAVLEPLEVLGVEAFKEHEVTIKLQFKTAPLQQWAVARAFRRKIWCEFKEVGIAQSQPQRTLWLASAGEKAAQPVPPAPPPAEPPPPRPPEPRDDEPR